MKINLSLVPRKDGTTDLQGDVHFATEDVSLFAMGIAAALRATDGRGTPREAVTHASTLAHELLTRLDAAVEKTNA